ncbi:hypothetical protein BJY52DRAFT_549373 [Lactarius psammicola]|nr:hypothetical protein BJY52DRAFT_549373 [Lactarius psammicola]
MHQLLCEPEDRPGSPTSTSVTRPKSMIMQARPFFRGIDWVISSTISSRPLHSHSPQFVQVLLEIHYCPTRSWIGNLGRPQGTRVQDSLIKVPSRPAMSAQIRDLTGFLRSTGA